MSLRFVAPQIPGTTFAQYYASSKRKGITDEGFLDKIVPFVCFTATILCLLRRCWQTGIFINNVAFIWASSGGKINYAYWQVSKVSGSPDCSGIRILLKTACTRIV